LDCPRPETEDKIMSNQNKDSAEILEPEQYSEAKPQHIDVAVINQRHVA
jgi:hypothetical protein